MGSKDLFLLYFDQLALWRATIHGYTILVFKPATQANSAWPSLCR